MASHKPRQLINGPGLRPLLDTTDFGAWREAVGQTLGYHRSDLLPGSVPFSAQMRLGAVEEFSVLQLRGEGKVQLLREQCGHGVLWLPLQGLSHERINGEEHVAEPGMGLLFRPGDQMQGLTSEAVSGFSILLPDSCLPVSSEQEEGARPSSLLHQGPAARRLLDAAWGLVRSAAHPVAGACFAAEALLDALLHWDVPSDVGESGEPVSAARRHRTVGDACQWMEEHLAERFTVVELSRAVCVAVRTLQYSFQEDLGCTPMAHAKRLRLRRLRQLLQDPDLASRTIAELMEASGLLACGVTAADYRQWCGESPRRTRQQSLGRHALDCGDLTA